MMKSIHDMDPNVVGVQHATPHELLERRGRAVWRAFHEVYLLEAQHRFSGDLKTIVRAFSQRTAHPDRELVTRALELLNERALPLAAGGAGDTQLVAFRQRAREPQGHRLARRHAASLGRRVISWASKGCLQAASRRRRHPDDAVLPPNAALVLQSLPADKVGHVPAHGYFFPGARYTFVDSKAAALGRCTSKMWVPDAGNACTCASCCEMHVR
jgi:hypothetical protein